LSLDAKAATIKPVAVPAMEKLKKYIFLPEGVGNIIKSIFCLYVIYFFCNMHLIKINLCTEVAAFFS